MNIGDVAREALAAGTSDEDTLVAVLKKFPEAKTKLASIRWYRSQLRRQARRGDREAGGEGAGRLKRVGGKLLGSKSKMTPELATQLRESAERSRRATHEKQMERQRLRLEALGLKVDRAIQWRRAAAIFRRKHGRWASPTELQEAGLI